jgi:hypothetical protein
MAVDVQTELATARAREGVTGGVAARDPGELP